MNPEEAALMQRLAPPRYRARQPGTAPDSPINQQHPELSWWDRTKIAATTGGDPQVARRWLEKNGFEVAEPWQGGDYNFTVRKPGGEWYRLDEGGPSLSDVSDVAGGITQLAAMAGGAALGQAAIPIPIVGGMIGAGLASGANEAALTTAGRALGSPMTGREQLGAVGAETAIGALGEGLVGGARAMKTGAMRLLGKRGGVASIPPSPLLPALRQTGRRALGEAELPPGGELIRGRGPIRQPAPQARAAIEGPSPYAGPMSEAEFIPETRYPVARTPHRQEFQPIPHPEFVGGYDPVTAPKKPLITPEPEAAARRPYMADTEVMAGGEVIQGPRRAKKPKLPRPVPIEPRARVVSEPDPVRPGLPRVEPPEPPKPTSQSPRIDIDPGDAMERRVGLESDLAEKYQGLQAETNKWAFEEKLKRGLRGGTPEAEAHWANFWQKRRELINRYHDEMITGLRAIGTADKEAVKIANEATARFRAAQRGEDRMIAEAVKGGAAEQTFNVYIKLQDAAQRARRANPLGQPEEELFDRLVSSQDITFDAMRAMRLGPMRAGGIALARTGAKVGGRLLKRLLNRNPNVLRRQAGTLPDSAAKSKIMNALDAVSRYGEHTWRLRVSALLHEPEVRRELEKLTG